MNSAFLSICQEPSVRDLWHDAKRPVNSRDQWFLTHYENNTMQKNYSGLCPLERYSGGIFEMYQILLRTYSPQGWWPINNEYKKRSTLSDAEKFEVIIGSLLTQNTSWIQVEKALNELRENNCLTSQKIIETKQEILGQYIKPAGYFNQKAERLKIIAQFLLQHPLKELQNMETHELRALLLSVKGIGPETADSIVLYAFSKPSFVIDAYTRRIMSRIGLCRKDVTYDELQELMVRNIPADVEMYNEYHALLVEHAKQHCQTKPVCVGCPLSSGCKKRI